MYTSIINGYIFYDSLFYKELYGFQKRTSPPAAEQPFSVALAAEKSIIGRNNTAKWRPSHELKI